MKELTGVPEPSSTGTLNFITERPGNKRPGRRPKIYKDTVEKMVNSLYRHCKNRTRVRNQFAEDVNKHYAEITDD